KSAQPPSVQTLALDDENSRTINLMAGALRERLQDLAQRCGFVKRPDSIGKARRLREHGLMVVGAGTLDRLGGVRGSDLPNVGNLLRQLGNACEMCFGGFVQLVGGRMLGLLRKRAEVGL